MNDAISLTLPVGEAWARVADLVLAGLGARLDLPYDRIDELQLAVGSILVDAPGPDVRVEAVAGVESLDVSVGPLAQSVASDPARKRVLDALADGVELSPSEDGASWIVLTFARGGAR